MHDCSRRTSAGRESQVFAYPCVSAVPVVTSIHAFWPPMPFGQEALAAGDGSFHCVISHYTVDVRFPGHWTAKTSRNSGSPEKRIRAKMHRFICIPSIERQHLGAKRSLIFFCTVFHLPAMISASIANVVLLLYTNDSVISAHVNSKLVGCVGTGFSLLVSESLKSSVT